MEHLTYLIYRIPLPLAVYYAAVGVLIWAYIGCNNTLINKPAVVIIKAINFLLLLLSLYGIACTTLINRTPDSIHSLIFIPFHNLIAAAKQHELYRSMLMNAVLFIPFGLSLSSLLPGNLHKGLYMIITAASAICISTAVEYLQYRYGLGQAELDDIIMNTAGAAFASVSRELAEWNLRERRIT